MGDFIHSIHFYLTGNIISELDCMESSIHFPQKPMCMETTNPIRVVASIRQVFSFVENISSLTTPKIIPTSARGRSRFAVSVCVRRSRSVRDELTRFARPVQGTFNYAARNSVSTVR